jgi:hypothetical protein
MKGFSITFVQAIFIGTLTVFSLFSALAVTRIDITGPVGSEDFGEIVTALPNGNIVVVDPFYDSATGANIGAVYLYNGATGAVISVLTGEGVDHAGIGGIQILPNGNYLVLSPDWRSNAGAVTFCNKTTGCSGIISPANSIVGSLANDRVGVYGVYVLSNGNYVVNSSSWNGNRGAFTWGNGTTGTGAIVSAANSMVGTIPGERVGAVINGNNGITPLSNGNYVVGSTAWSNNRGAATFCDGTSAACVGTISSANSLIGTTPSDLVGYEVIGLTNGNYVVRSHRWNNGGVMANAGAITWASGVTGIAGEISAANSLVGDHTSDRIGGGSIALFTNGNYVVKSADWNGNRGAATFVNGTTGITGLVSSENSLVGAIAGDHVGNYVIPLPNGNYVVSSPNCDVNGLDGAITFGNGTSGISGIVTQSNSLIGAGFTGESRVTVLANSNYVVRTHLWNGGRGAVTFGSGTTGVQGLISASNSLVGANADDRIGSGGVTALTNGNYSVSSPNWNIRRGAVTLCDGTVAACGTVTASNSLTGDLQGDEVGAIFSDNGIQALPNGNYVVNSSNWHDNRGAATWGNGVTGTVGPISAANSFVGENPNDYVGLGAFILANGNYVLPNSNWGNTRGAITFGSAAGGGSGIVSASNSLIGANPNDRVGSETLTLTDGSYLTVSPQWGGDLGAVTWGNGITGVAGIVSSANSLVGSTPVDQIGNGTFDVNGITALPNGNYAIFSPTWDNGSIVNAGAVSLGKPNMPLTGTIIDENSVRGTRTNYGSTLTFAYDTVNRQFIVGRQGENIVTLFRYEINPGVFDFDGDGKTDLSIFRPSVGEWWYLKSSNGGNAAAQFGASTDKITPADFTGDGKTDIAFWRPSNGFWFVLRSEDFSYYSFPFGTTSDIPAVGDFDGDGKADATIFRPSNATWYISKSSGGTLIQQFGQNGDVPVVSDYDGDGKADIAIYRVALGEWWIQRSTAGIIAFQFGNSADKPVPGDFTGDGKADVGLFRPSTGEWFVLRSENQSYYSFPFGTNGDIPAPGDYDGDGKFDATVFRPSSSTWYAQRSTAGTLIQSFGQSGDTPVPSAFVP